MKDKRCGICDATDYSYGRPFAGKWFKSIKFRYGMVCSQCLHLTSVCIKCEEITLATETNENEYGVCRSCMSDIDKHINKHIDFDDLEDR